MALKPPPLTPPFLLGESAGAETKEGSYTQKLPTYFRRGLRGGKVSD